MANTTDTSRIAFSKALNPLPYPDFLDVQLKSFQEFFQLQTATESRKQEGLYKVFAENFPIKDTRNSFTLEFIDYCVDPPKYSIEECISRGLTYSVPLKAKLKLSCNDPEHVDFETQVKDVYLGPIPYMTPSGTFVINGAERVVVSQLHRSPGVFFSSNVLPSGARSFSARIIPFRGTWIEIATDANNILYAYIDRKKKVSVATLMRAIGYSTDREIFNVLNIGEEVAISDLNESHLNRRLADRIGDIVIKTEYLDAAAGEVSEVQRFQVLYDRNTVLDEEVISALKQKHKEKQDLPSVYLFKEDDDSATVNLLLQTLNKDTSVNEVEAWRFFYFLQRSVEAPDDNAAKEAFNNLFFSEKRYDLGDVGRYRINSKLNLDVDPDKRVLTKEDIVAIVKHLLHLSVSGANVDDIDHLSNRRVRTVGEQLAAQFGVGLARMARTVRERMNVRDNEVFAPTDLVNAKTISSVVSSFFGTNQLSQFMDQTNPLAEITHKRRLSALGPGGLTRERAGFAVRDVHYTHYGRLCPIETPEGPNIGLISSLCVYAKVNDLGFIETPYREVKDGKVDFDSVPKYYTAEEEEEKNVAQGNAPLYEDGTFQRSKVKARYAADFPVISPSQVDLIDVSPSQIASIAASLIPFLEHDDANRALMGSNMMRQAVPLIQPEAPIVGTGIEAQLVRDSRTQIMAEGSGEVIYVDADQIRVRYDKTEEELFVSFEDPIVTYHLPKYRKTNQNTTIDLKPLCRKGDRIEKGQILTEGYATQNGELALGRNILVAYMPWKGYNYEDAIVLNERIVREDYFTSVHVEEQQLEVRETKRGLEELTNDIPNVSEEATKDLGEDGIVRIGAHIVPGDILVGKITPKGESDPTPEERLLRAIFGDKASDVKDASLKASPSLRGVVIDTKLFAKKVDTKRKEIKETSDRLEAEHRAKKEGLRKIFIDKLCKITDGRTANLIEDFASLEIIAAGKKFNRTMLENIEEYGNVKSGNWTDDEHTNKLIATLISNYIRKDKELEAAHRRRTQDETIGDELASGIVKTAKVYIAKKRKIQVGDKMAGRHGNKGIVSKIVRQEDMPFLADGTPVDICLNPLGVPSRMNLGQIFEAVLARAGRRLNERYATPIFDGATEKDIDERLKLANIDPGAKTQLYDGGTGEPFDQKATVGVTYFLKLGHMVDDKMHARSIGPYSLVTQQPLGGKAQFGGQRFGEMEVWALEAFGAAHILQEILTIKSDDTIGRSRAYESIVKGTPMPTPGIPESLNVLMNELKGLGLSLTLE